jgi:hypothetical protein
MTTSEKTSGAKDKSLPPPWTSVARGPIHFVLPERRRAWNWLDLNEQDANILWRSLGDFVAYLNRRYLERPEHRVPPCWAEHGPLVEELTTLLFARWHAFQSNDASIGGAQFFHTHTLPGFIDRMGQWIGPDRLRRCQAGRHEDRVVEEPAEAGNWEDRCIEIERADVHERGRGRPVPDAGSSDTRSADAGSSPCDPSDDEADAAASADTETGHAADAAPLQLMRAPDGRVLDAESGELEPDGGR